jgi:hypothetical protein
MVTWEDNYFGDYDIVAQEVLGSGLLLGVPIGVCLQSSNQNNAAITYNDYYGEYIILWEDLRYGSADIFGQAFSSNALFLGYNELINDDPVTSIQPAICSRNIAGEYLTAWSGFYSGDYDILGQILY